MSTKPKMKKSATEPIEPVEQILHDGTPEFELLVQSLLNELALELDIVKRRRELGLTQKEVAKLAGLEQPHVAKLESGKSKNLEIKTLIRVAVALDARVEVRLIPNDKIAPQIRQPKAASRPSARAANLS
jgi:predicted XRE-type DNA-binding protein